MGVAMTSRLRLAFMGTPHFSVPILQALADGGHDIAVVYCQPPRGAGRGQKEQLSPVHQLARSRNIEVRTPVSLKPEDVQRDFAGLELDVAVVAAYGLILPAAILASPKYGCLNVHASLLPRWRGAAPIQRAILAGDTESGVTIMQMDEGLDTGGMLKKAPVAITPDTTGQSLHDDLSLLGARLIGETLTSMSRATLAPISQPDGGVTYAPKLAREEGKIDWHKSAAEIDRQIRAFTPWPGAWFEHGGDRFKILSAVPARGYGAGDTAGAVLDGLNVACGEGVLQIKTIQRAGKGSMTVDAFLNGYDLPSGTLLASDQG